MKLDTVIERRFNELDEKATALYNMHRNGRFVDEVNFQAWATSVLSLFQKILGTDSPHYENFLAHYKKHRGYFDEFQRCRGVFLAAKEDYESGYLFTIRGLIKAEDTTEILVQAEDLLKAKYKDPACILVGVSLEIALKELCTRNNIAIAKLDAMNVELCKKEVYNVGTQKQITAWAHWRNKAAHGEWDEYTANDVSDMLKGVLRFTSEYL